MSILYILTIALQVIFCVHVLRTGRPMYWMFIIILFPLIGMIVYFLMEMLPTMRGNYKTMKAINTVAKTLDPRKAQREAKQRLDAVNSMTNRLDYAQHSLACGDYQIAHDMYSSCLTGMYANDPNIMLGLAQAQFALGNYQASEKTLTDLIQANPDFSSHEGHFLYAKSLEKNQKLDLALQEYEQLSRSYPGEEPRYRYALLLKQQGQPALAQQVVDEAIANFKIAPKYYQKEQQEWISKMRGI